MSEQITITHERADDIPVIVAFLLKMRVAELIDKHFPTNGNWTGLSLGQMLVVWLRPRSRDRPLGLNEPPEK
jgi:hypothetical protein